MRIVWLAAADARGHLMRAHLCRGLLGRAGVGVDVVTTSEEGRAFLAALGTPSELLSSHYGVAFDAWQNMARHRTEACVLRYLFSPSRAAADRRRILAMSEGAALLVNDFHPLLLVAGPRGERRPCPVVHVYGEHLWRAIEDNFQGRGPAFVDRGYGALVRALRDQAYARIEHGFGAERAGERDPGERTFRLLPLVAAPRRAPEEVRAALGVRPGARLAAVYLNPHFADPALAGALEAALAREGFAVHAVGEGFRGRPGFRPHDPAFVDVVAAADLLVSAPGMGAVGHARLLGVPFLALLTDQPEQRDNVGFLAAGGAPFEAVELRSGDLEERLRGAVARLASASAPRDRASSMAVIGAVHRRWTEVLTGLAAERLSTRRPSRLSATHHEV